jgi:hypothetical protein
MLAHGDEPNFGIYSEPIKKGLDYILKQMSKETGYIGRSMYNHGFGTLALAEAYGAVDDPRLGPALDKAVRLIINSQEKNSLGRVALFAGKFADADTTVSGAQMVALFAARNAGIAVKEEAIQKGLRFFRALPDGGGRHGLHFEHRAERHADRDRLPGLFAREGQEQSGVPIRFQISCNARRRK